MSVSGTFDVTAADTASALGSGDVELLATPRLLAWLENVTVEAGRAGLDAGQTTVGTAVRLRHRRPTPVGGRVTVTADLTAEADGRLTFEVSATDQDGELVAVGEIDRAVVTRTDFG